MEKLCLIFFLMDKMGLADDFKNEGQLCQLSHSGFWLVLIFDKKEKCIKGK